jgi:uncharacterized protein (TIGR04255 family)
MPDKWPQLENPPVILAVMEIKFQMPPEFDVNTIKRNDAAVRKELPDRQDNIAGNINLPKPSLGISTAQVSSQHVGYSYASQDKSYKLGATKDQINFIIEGKYPGWEVFKSTGLRLINSFSHYISDVVINRFSIRFINKLNIKEITTVNEYFNTAISAKEGTIVHPIDSYFFRYTMRIPDSPIHVNVNQSLEEKGINGFDFVFDIDVLCQNTAKYRNLDLTKGMEDIRDIKNQVFFSNLTEKTLKLL